MSVSSASILDPAGSIMLPAPRQRGGKPLLDALGERRSAREFSQEEPDLELLSTLLWAAFGVNRLDGHRTAPSARDWQEIDIYVALRNGLYLYDPHQAMLLPVLAEDVRAATGEQDFAALAPINLVYVADLARVAGEDAAEQRFCTTMDAGFIAQNVYLFCASEGLATVVRGLIDRERLAKLMRLRPGQKVIAAQSVGYPQA